MVVLLLLFSLIEPALPSCPHEFRKLHRSLRERFELEPFLDALEGVTIEGKSGTPFRVATRSIDQSLEKKRSHIFAGTESERHATWQYISHNVEFRDEGGETVGYAQVLATWEGAYLGATVIRGPFQREGLTTYLLAQLYKKLPSGKKLALVSGNVETNIFIREEIERYQSLRGKSKLPLDLQRLSLFVGNEARIAYDEKRERSCLWVNVLRKAGFDSVEIEILQTDLRVNILASKL